jgi:phasin
MARESMPGFEIPPEMRRFAEQSMQQARQAFDGFISAAHRAVSDVEGRANAARVGVRDVGEKAMTFAERNVAASFEFAQKLVRAKDVDEIMRLQTDYVKQQMRALNDQATELGQTAAKAAAETAKPKS